VPTITSVPPTLIPASGASLYLIEGPDDWLYDGMQFWNEIPGSKDTTWVGDKGLRLVLRLALSQKSMSFKAQADFIVTSGYLTEATLTHPDRIQAPPFIGFHVKFSATLGNDPDSVNLVWKTSLVTTDKRGTETAEPFAEGSGSVPLGATLIMRRPKGEGRFYFLLLRIASLKK